MAKLSELMPTKKEHVYKLLERVGIRVPPNRNQNFLSRPAFNIGNKVVLNFWYKDQIKPQGEDIIVRWDIPTEELDARMKRVPEAIKYAIRKNLPIRIIVLYGKPARKGSKVFKRSLDSANWSVTEHDPKTGKFTITRGADRENAVNDLSDAPIGNLHPDRATRVVNVIERVACVRKHALKRAAGKCEHCNEQGFKMPNEQFYLEAHHIIALSRKGGRDTVDNVIALCPNHHRQAHYGEDAESLEQEFIATLKQINRRAALTPLQRPN